MPWEHELVKFFRRRRLMFCFPLGFHFQRSTPLHCFVASSLTRPRADISSSCNKDMSSSAAAHASTSRPSANPNAPTSWVATDFQTYKRNKVVGRSESGKQDGKPDSEISRSMRTKFSKALRPESLVWLDEYNNGQGKFVVSPLARSTSIAGAQSSCRGASAVTRRTTRSAAKSRPTR